MVRFIADELMGIRVSGAAVWRVTSGVLSSKRPTDRAEQIFCRVTERAGLTAGSAVMGDKPHHIVHIETDDYRGIPYGRLIVRILDVPATPTAVRHVVLDFVVEHHGPLGRSHSVPFVTVVLDGLGGWVGLAVEFHDDWAGFAGHGHSSSSQAHSWMLLPHSSHWQPQ